ncbi:MAG: tRNA (guanosine(46)-N7)-methyltransferase TrmB [Treponema sp.]|jgi:tRNA (guanine-N7-)-methyltransferase|nr:tRNA (guanosine(46)-N7)-methyltransferase TrmB [Treponema sp.]
MEEGGAADLYRGGTEFRRGVKSYVLRAGRMSGAQRRSYDRLAPVYCIPPGDKGFLDYAGIFGNDRPVTVEIGFGMGAATAVIAQDNPEKNYLGIEVHRPGIGKLLWEIERRGLENIRIIEHDAAEVLERMIPPNSAAAFHLFFPDPWPKKRHHKRRLVQRPFTDLLADRLSPGGYIYMVTDWAEYGDWALKEFSARKDLVNPSGGFAPPRDWRPETKFERRGLDKQYQVRELYFEKQA